jgi:hypothetical protein
MLCLRGNDVSLVRPRFEHSPDRCVIALRTAAGKNDLNRIGRADQVANLLSSDGKSFPHGAPEAMDTGWIAITIGQKWQHRLGHLR